MKKSNNALKVVEARALVAEKKIANAFKLEATVKATKAKVQDALIMVKKEVG